MTFFNYTSQSGGQFSAELREGQRNVEVFPWPGVPAGGVVDVIRASGQEWQGVYPTTEVDPQPPDAYQVRDDPPFSLAFAGTEYQVGAMVQKTNHWVSRSADDILERKNVEGERYATHILFSSAQTQDNPNVYIVVDEIQRARINNVSNFLADRMKDRVLGQDSSQGYDPNRPVGTPPGPDPLPETYWARDIKVRLVNRNNGNTLVSMANELDWGKVIKTIGLFDEDIASALDLYRIDISLAYDAYVADPTEANRTALITKDATDQAYGWPDYYDGPISARVRIL